MEFCKINAHDIVRETGVFQPVNVWAWVEAADSAGYGILYLVDRGESESPDLCVIFNTSVEEIISEFGDLDSGIPAYLEATDWECVDFDCVDTAIRRIAVEPWSAAFNAEGDAATEYLREVARQESENE